MTFYLLRRYGRAALGWSKTMRRLLISFLLLLLAGVAVRVVAAPSAPAVPKIGIVSAIGDKFYARKFGLFALGNDFKEMAIASWGIDEMMTAKLRAALSPRFDVRPVTYKRAVFAAFPDRSGFLAQYFRPELVRTDVFPQGLDAYLVVVKSERSYGPRNSYGGSSQLVHGLGSAAGNTDVDPIVFVHAYYHIALVDGHDFQIKSQAASEIPGPRKYFWAPDFMSSPSRQVDASLWPKSLDAAANQQLKGVVVDLIDKSLPPTLQKMQLVQ
jgi:hypothetical protein